MMRTCATAVCPATEACSCGCIIITITRDAPAVDTICILLWIMIVYIYFVMLFGEIIVFARYVDIMHIVIYCYEPVARVQENSQSRLKNFPCPTRSGCSHRIYLKTT